MLTDLFAGQVWDFVEHGEAVLVDLRSPSAFARLHPKDAISLPYSARNLSERLTAVLPSGIRIVLVAADPLQAKAAGVQLQDGAFQVSGIVRDGMSGWQEANLPVASLPEVSIQELVRLIDSPATTILDVREPMEWEIGHVPGATLIALGDLRQRLDRLPRQGRIAVICEAGVRSCVAASLLQIRGFADVANVPEGTRGYRNAGFPLAYWSEISQTEK